MKYETNIFKIENLHELSAVYTLFEIRGLVQSDGDDDYEINIQHIVKTLSYKLKQPITNITREGIPHLVVRNDKEILALIPTEYTIKRNEVVHFVKVDQVFKLDFVKYDQATKAIIARFLQFDVHAELHEDHRIWQPEAGDPFFSKNSSDVVGEVGIYSGFDVRLVEVPGGDGFGLAIDVTKKYVSSVPLKMKLTRAEFKKLDIDKSHLVYNYQGKRYEIKAHQISDLNASQYKFPRASDGKMVTLLEETQAGFKNSGESMPPEVANLPNDASVLMYKTNDNHERGVIAGLCYKVFDTEDSVVRRIHRRSIVHPFYRRRLIRIARTKHFDNLKFGTVSLQICKEPITVKNKKIVVPDILLGNETRLSLRGTSDSIQTTIERLGRQRIDALDDAKVGFYTKAPFEAQYFVVPETLHNMYCNEQYFLKDLMAQVDRMHAGEKGWKPNIIPYDNRTKKNTVDVGFEILQKIDEFMGKNKGGYALVVLPSDVDRIKRKHDELAALIVSECQEKYELQVGIMHGDTLYECFRHTSNNGQSKYSVTGEMVGKYKGYVRGVAINQVLLNNERWPFILHTPLHADLTIGIDVKRNVAGFTFVDKYSKNIVTRSDKSDNREKLSPAQVVKMLVKGIELQAKYANYAFRRIVIHRDGRLFPSEREGIEKAIAILKQRGVLPNDAFVTFVEIPKHPMASFRLFDVQTEYDVIRTSDDNGKTFNPEIGSWMALSSTQALLCTTGREFRRNGSSRPLLINLTPGGIGLEEIIEDLYYLSTLAYTKPDDCSRLPITLRLTDRKINSLGSEFDFESLEILRSENY